MKKTIALAIVVAATLIGCGTEAPAPQKQETNTFACKQENVLAPKWTCVPMVEGAYAGVGIANKSAAGMSHMRRVALMNGRSDLAQQIETSVKDRMKGFTQTTGVGDTETVDSVTESVTKQLSQVVLQGSKAVDAWTAPSGALYLLVTVPEKQINDKAKDLVKSSLKNDNALWQQFQAKNAFDDLDKAFNE